MIKSFLSNCDLQSSKRMQQRKSSGVDFATPSNGQQPFHCCKTKMLLFTSTSPQLPSISSLLHCNFFQLVSPMLAAISSVSSVLHVEVHLLQICEQPLSSLSHNMPVFSPPWAPPRNPFLTDSSNRMIDCTLSTSPP